MTTPNPVIFICGSSRSGTTMMSRIMGNNPNVFSFQELHYFDELCSTAIAGDKPSAEKTALLTAKLMAIQRDGYFGPRDTGPYLEEAKSLIEKNSFSDYARVLEYFLRTESLRNGKEIPCEQTPQSVFALEEILEHINGARVVIMVRDPREVLLSQKGKWKRRKLSGGKIPWIESVRSRINYHPVTISRIWNAVYREALRFEHHPAVLLVRYEDLTEQPEVTVRKICDHCGIDFTPSMLDVPVVGSSNYNDTTAARGIEKSRRGKWSAGLNDAEITICQDITMDQMQRFGYEISPIRRPALKTTAYSVLYPFQLGAALLFNLKRLRNPMKLLKRFAG